MTDTWQEAETRVAEMIRGVCVELADVPVYAVGAQKLCGSPADNLGGMTDVNMDLILRPFIPSWRGRGLCFLYGGLPSPDDLLPIAIHELGHAFQRGFLDEIVKHPDDTTPSFASEALREVRAVIDFVRTAENPKDSELTKLLCTNTVEAHGAQWHRCVLHLRHRVVWKYELLVGVSELNPYDFAMLPFDTGKAHEALLQSGEYDACAELTFAEILTRRMPAAFEAVFAAIVDNKSKNPTSVEKEIAA